MRRPVAIDVSSDAAVSGVGLTVLAPQAVGGLRVLEAIGVDDREDVEVVFVQEGSVVGVREELVCGVLDDLVMLVLKFSRRCSGEELTMVVIHSRAWTVACQSTAFFEPLPPLPQMWIPLIS